MSPERACASPSCRTLGSPFVSGKAGSVRAYVRDSGYDLIGVGGRALVADAVLQELRDLSEG